MVTFRPKIRTAGFAAVLVIAVLAALLFAPAQARVGLAISPSSGQYFLNREGGSIDVLVSNYGDENTIFSVRVSDEAAGFATLDKSAAAIAPGESEKFRVNVAPAGPVEYGRAYVLTVVATAQSSTGAPGLVSGNLKLFFNTEAGKKDYVVSSTAPLTLSPPESVLLSRLFTFFAAIVLVGVAYYLIRTRGPWKDE